MSAPRLYLITPLVTDASAFLPSYEAALGAADIACLLLRAAGEDIVRRLAPIAQQGGTACLISDPQLAAAADCDGVHVEGVGVELAAALAAMKPQQRIVGAGGLLTRHEAMCAGEAGVDYVMFGGPDEHRDFAEIREKTAWWTELFNPPCVAYAGVLDEIAALAAAGAEFIALCDAVWSDPHGPAAAVETAKRSLLREAAA